MAGPGIERLEFQGRAEVKSGPGRREDQESPAGRWQAQLQQAQRLEGLGQLAGEIAQDFNNLLGAILGYAAFVSAELAAASGPDSAERLESVRRDLGQITLAAEQAASRTYQAPAFVHPAVVHPQVLSLDDVVIDVQEMLRQTLAEHVELVTTLAGDLWPVLADPAQKSLLGAIMVGAAGYISKQTRGADLVSAVRTVGPGRSILDPYASRPVMAQMGDRMASADPAAALTGQEKRVLELIGLGLTNRQIAERMCLAEKTAKNYVSSLLAKLGMHRRAEAAAFAVRHASDHDALTPDLNTHGTGWVGRMAWAEWPEPNGRENKAVRLRSVVYQSRIVTNELLEMTRLKEMSCLRREAPRSARAARPVPPGHPAASAISVVGRGCGPGLLRMALLIWACWRGRL